MLEAYNHGGLEELKAYIYSKMYICMKEKESDVNNSIVVQLV